MRKWLLLVMVCACDKRIVEVQSGPDTKVVVKATQDFAGEQEPSIEVSVHQPMLRVPVLVPMPIPYAKPCELAEKP